MSKSVQVFDEKRAVDAEMDELLRQSLALQRNVTNVAYQLQKVIIFWNSKMEENYTSDKNFFHTESEQRMW